MSMAALSVLVGLVLAQGSHDTTELSDYNRMRTSKGECLWWPGNDFLSWMPSDTLDVLLPGSLACIQRAFAIWQTQMDDCGSLNFLQLETTSSAETGYLSGSAKDSLILLREGSCHKKVNAADPCWKNNNCGNTYKCWQYDESALAITLTTFLADTGQLLNADIEINGNYTYAVDDIAPCRNCFFEDLQAVMVHEIGHVLGLAHSNKAGSVMYPTLAAGLVTDHSLDLDSAQFVCDVYPKNQPSQGCTTSDASSPSHVDRSAGCVASSTSNGLALGVVVLLLLRFRRYILRS